MPDKSSTIDTKRLYRVFVTARHSEAPEYTVFVEAGSHNAANEKAAEMVAALETPFSTKESVRERLYNCYSAQELLEERTSEDLELRLFETGWSHGKPTYFMPDPLFLVVHPAALMRKWASLPATEHELGK